MAKVLKEKNMAVSVDALKRAILDYESCPDFLPEVVGATVLKQDSDSAEVQFDINLIKRFQYTLGFHSAGGDEISWKLKSSDFFKQNEGRWVLKSNGPASTHALYELEVAFGFFVPGFITKTLTETNLPTLLDRFEGQAKKLSS